MLGIFWDGVVCFIFLLYILQSSLDLLILVSFQLGMIGLFTACMFQEFSLLQ